MASVVFINPWNFHDEGVKYTAQQLQYIWHNPPLGIVLLATELRDAGHNVTICDLERDLVINGGNIETTLANMCDLVKGVQPDFVGVPIISVRYLEAKRVIQLCHDIRQDTGHPFKIAVGNIHATYEPEYTIRDNPHIDAVFLGEADKSFLAWVNGKPIEQIAGVAFWHGDKIIVSPQLDTFSLDELPFPDWNFIDVGFYSAPKFVYYGREVKPARSLDIIASRGCVYRCTFCAYNAMKPRWHSVDYIIQNIKYLLDNFPIDSLYFLDSSIGNNRQQLIGICQAIIDQGINKRFRWSANIRSNQVDEQLLRLMWKAGCRRLLYGFESGSQRILDSMKKGCTVEQNEKAVQLHRKLGFPCLASMIIGFPGETIEDLQTTLFWLRRVLPPIIGINTFVPLPGSEDYTKLKDMGQLHVTDAQIWRTIGEVNNPESKLFTDIPADTFWKYFEEMITLGNESKNKTHEKPAIYHLIWSAKNLSKGLLGKFKKMI